MELQSTASVQEFFHEVISEAIRAQGLSATEPTEFYLVNLLSDFTTTPVDDEPLALKLATATFASSEDRVKHLREIADKSLYVSGFFADSLRRRSIDPNYYISMGGSAYAQLATHYRKHKVYGGVYDELGQKFRSFVDVLGEISERTSTSHLTVVQLYERWLRTGSEWMERRLRVHGLLPRTGEGQS